MEIIDRGDEGLELIVFRVLDTRIILASDDTLEILDDGLDGEKYRPNPEEIDKKDEREPDKVHEEKVFQDITDEFPFWSIITEGTEIEGEKEFREVDGSRESIRIGNIEHRSR